jgi:hypothetical protein
MKPKVQTRRVRTTTDLLISVECGEKECAPCHISFLSCPATGNVGKCPAFKDSRGNPASLRFNGYVWLRCRKCLAAEKKRKELSHEAEGPDAEGAK